MSDTKFFRQYLDILNEGPPPGVGPNAPARPATQQPVQPNAEPTQYQQAKDAVGQQVQNYKDISGQIDQGVKQGQLDQKTASAAKSDLAGTMMRGGYEAGKAAMQGRDPSTAYVGSMVRSIGNTAANSGLDASMKKAGADVSKYRGPNAQDIRNDPAFKKASPEQQAQALKDFDAIRNLSDEEYNYYTGGKAFKELGGQAAKAGQDMIDQKDWGKGGRAGFSPKANELFGLDPTRQATDAEMKAAATGQQPQAPAAPTAPTQPQGTQQPTQQPQAPVAPTVQPAAPTAPTQPQGTQQPTQQPTTEEKDNMDDRQMMRKYMDFLDEAPAQAINPNDPNAAAFGKKINSSAATPTQPNPKLAAINQQVAKASNVVDPNQKYGGGYDPTKVQYATGPAVNNQSSGYTAQSQAQKTAPTSPAGSATQSTASDASKKNAIGGGTQVASSQPVNNQSSGYSAQSQAQRSAPISQQPVNNQSSGYSAQSQAQRSAPVSSSGATRGASAQAAAEPSLASQYISANQPQTQTASKPTPSSPSLASQYISANQPQTATASTTQPTSDVLATQALQAQDQGTSGQSKGVPAAFGQVAEEKGENSDDELLKSIIRLIKQ